MELCSEYNLPCPYVDKTISIFPCDESQGRCECWRRSYFDSERPSDMSPEGLAEHLGIKPKNLESKTKTQ